MVGMTQPKPADLLLYITRCQSIFDFKCSEAVKNIFFMQWRMKMFFMQSKPRWALLDISGRAYASFKTPPRQQREPINMLIRSSYWLDIIGKLQCWQDLSASMLRWYLSSLPIVLKAAHLTSDPHNKRRLIHKAHNNTLDMFSKMCHSVGLSGGLPGTKCNFQIWHVICHHSSCDARCMRLEKLQGFNSFRICWVWCLGIIIQLGWFN